MKRRSFLTGVIATVAAPAIVRAEWIMPVSVRKFYPVIDATSHWTQTTSTDTPWRSTMLPDGVIELHDLSEELVNFLMKGDLTNLEYELERDKAARYLSPR